MTFDPDKFVPTHRTPQGLVRAKQWHKTGDHPAVRPLEEIDRRGLQRQNLPAYEAHANGQLHVGYVDKIGTFVYPGQYIWEDETGGIHLRDSNVHEAMAVPLPGVENTTGPGQGNVRGEDRPLRGGTATVTPPPLDARQGETPTPKPRSEPTVPGTEPAGDAFTEGPEGKEK